MKERTKHVEHRLMYLISVLSVAVLYVCNGADVSAKGITDTPEPTHHLQLTDEQRAKLIAGELDPDRIVGLAFETSGKIYRVIGQPKNDVNYVSADPQEITEFEQPRQQTKNFNWLLVHNYNPAGKEISKLKQGDNVWILTPSGEEKYQVIKKEEYQALSPTSNTADFVDLNKESSTFNQRITTADLYGRMTQKSLQARGDQEIAILQTCIEANGELSWGRLFVEVKEVDPGK
jgi:hypothetical protein